MPSASVVAPAATRWTRKPRSSRTQRGVVPKFRWPANGRVIAGYRAHDPRPQQNDGINIALPREHAGDKSRGRRGRRPMPATRLKGMATSFWCAIPNGYVTAYSPRQRSFWSSAETRSSAVR